METVTDGYSEFDKFWDELKAENLTEQEFLTRILGPKNLPWRLVIPLTLAYATIFVSGVIGNVATCIVIIKNTTMHTSTNYYLFSLAISDLILLTIGLPNELSNVWQQYPWIFGVALCKIRAYVSEMSSYVSVITIVAFSVERYLAICHPLSTYTLGGSQRPILIIIISWLIALISASPFAIFSTVNYVEYPPDSGQDSMESAVCGMLTPNMPFFPLYELSCFIFFLIPMLIILIVYTRMGLTIRNSAQNNNTSRNESAHFDSRQVQSRRSIIKMLSAVVVLFFVCWAPFHAQRLLYVYAQEADYYPDLNEWLYIVSGVLYYFSTTINPILYNLMSHRYREAFKGTMCCCRGNRSRGFNPEMYTRYGNENLLRANIKSAVIIQAKGMLKNGVNCHECNRDSKSLNTQGKGNIVDCPRTPLIRHDHSKLTQQQSTDCSAASNNVGESALTDISFV